MSIQTKMTPEMRETLNSMRNEYPETQIFQFPDVGMTVAITPAGNGFADISTSYKAPDETKFRKNVGEYLARDRWMNGEFTRVKLSEENFEYFASTLTANMSVE